MSEGKQPPVSGGPPGAGGNGGTGNGPAGEPAAGPGALLSELSRLRRQARAARHGYWFPLVLFGLLICASAPLYVAAQAPAAGTGVYASSRPLLLLTGMPGGLRGFYLGWYWMIALMAGYLLTVLWYRRHARRAGVRTPARSYLVTGIVLVVLAMVLPPLTRLVPRLGVLWLPLADGWIRGTLAFLVIAAGLWVLAWAERSRALAAIALAYTGAALLASLYNVENILSRLGWNPGSSRLAGQLTVLPDVLLPAVVLLAAGLAAFLAQRRQRSA